MTDLYLSAVAHELGRPVPIAKLPERVSAPHLEGLHQQGLREVRVADQTAITLGGRAARRSLSGARTGRAVDTVIYSSQTCTVDSGEDRAQLLQGMGVLDADVRSAAGHGCGNFGPSVRLATEVIGADVLKRVVVVVADCSGDTDRLLLTSGTVLSDGAAACVITAAPPMGPGFLIRGIGTARLPHPPPRQPVSAARFIKTGVTLAVAKLPAETEFDKVVVSNYGVRARQWLAKLAGFVATDIVDTDVAGVGHCYSADGLVTLHDATARGAFSAGDSVLVLCSGPTSWSAVALVYVEQANLERDEGHNS